MASGETTGTAARAEAPSAPWTEALARVDGGFDLLRLAETFSGILPDLGPEDRRALTGLALVLLLAAQEGHTRLPFTGPDGLEERLAPFLPPSLSLPDVLARPALQAAFGSPGQPGRPILLGGGWAGIARLQAAEGRLAARILALLERPSPGAAPGPEAATVLDAPIGRGPQGHALRLSEAQRQAVLQAAARPLTLITGGPGTGKTSIVAAILRVAMREGLDLPDIALAAPTGKAAQRMGESIQLALGRLEQPDGLDRALLASPPVPQTLHRLLGNLSSGRRGYRHHGGNPLRERLVIVDEGSMVGLELMEALLDALDPEARLVLLGDAQQLPSVEAGAVFRDLKEALGRRPDSPVVALTESHRMDPGDPAGSSVFLTAQAMLLEPTEALRELDSPGVLHHRGAWTEITGSHAEHAEIGAADLKAFLHGYLKAEVLDQPGFQEAGRRIYHHDGAAWARGDAEALETLFRAHERTKLLTPLRQAAILQSADGLNAALHAAYGRHLGVEGSASAGRSVHAGEPVMVIANDYVRNLFNGDQGVVVLTRLDGGIHQAVAFREGAGFRLVPHRAIRDALVLGWALTVHKAQGSEFDRVVVVLPARDTPLLTREILYTALTRARRGAALLGSREALEEGLRRATVRHTGLREALASDGHREPPEHS